MPLELVWLGLAWLGWAWLGLAGLGWAGLAYRPVDVRAVRPAYALSSRLRHSPVNLDGRGSATTRD
jgi:hypothetical protein